VALERTDVSEEPGASFIRVTKIGALGTTQVAANVVPSSPILLTLIKEVLSSPETSVLTRATGRSIPEDDILQVEDGLCTWLGYQSQDTFNSICKDKNKHQGISCMMVSNAMRHEALPHMRDISHRGYIPNRLCRIINTISDTVDGRFKIDSPIMAWKITISACLRVSDVAS
jgi:hypothetical protein